MASDLLQELGRHLLFEVHQIQDVDLAGGERVAITLPLMNRLELGEFFADRRGVVELVLGLFLGREVLVLAAGVGVPPGQAGGDFQRADVGFVIGDKGESRESAVVVSAAGVEVASILKITAAIAMIKVGRNIGILRWTLG